MYLEEKAAAEEERHGVVYVESEALYRFAMRDAYFVYTHSPARHTRSFIRDSILSKEFANTQCK